MTLTSLVPIQYRVLSLVALVGISIAFGWVKGVSSEQVKKRIQDDQQAIKVLQVKVKQADVTLKVVTHYVDRIKVVKEKGDTIIKQVPLYITKDDDSHCSVPEHFSVLWNAANTGNIPDTTRPIDEAATAISNPSNAD